MQCPVDGTTLAMADRQGVDDRHFGGYGGGHERKRKGFLSEIFEFGD